MNRREALERAGLVLGYAVSAPLFAGIMNGCKAVPELTYKPSFFPQDGALIISEIAEIIIPKTDTPGAKEAGVPAFIDSILGQCYNKEDQDRFLSGLKSFDEEAKKTYGDLFIDLEPAQQQEHVKRVHDEAIASFRNGAKEWPFILMMKELTVVGFFTSEPGATQVLQYAPVPGAYHGCLPLAEVGKTWATS